MEVTVRSAHAYLVTRLEREDVAGADTCRHILEADLWAGLERCAGDTYRRGDDVALSGIVGHGVGTDRRLGVVGLEGEDVELLPRTDIFIADERLVEVLVVVDGVVGGDINLRVGSRNKVHVLARWQCDLKLF